MQSSGDVKGRRLDGATKKAGAAKLGAGNSGVWSYGRPVDAGHTRTSRNKQGMGPTRPSAAIPGNVSGANQGDRAHQQKHS